jgi:hypothetical protein
VADTGGNRIQVIRTCSDQEKDNDGDGYPSFFDCNDNDTIVYPNAPEVCDGQDNDCDGLEDNGLILRLNDLQVGVCEGSTKACEGATGWVNNYSGISNYEMTELTEDGFDNDCDSHIDEVVTAHNKK